MMNAVKSSLFRHRELGVLLHPSSLFSREDIGTLGKAAYQFVDFLEKSGASLWQILPLIPNGRHDSPYFGHTTLGGNPWLIDLELLGEAGLLERPELYPRLTDHRVPFLELPRKKLPQLLSACARFLATPTHPWQGAFVAFSKSQKWLEETAHFYALKELFGEKAWWDWEASARTRRADWVTQSKAELQERIDIYKVLFFLADFQWAAVKSYANGKGIRVLGDLPFYVEADSVDVWIHQDQFKLNEAGRPTVVSGVPPDYFREPGQLCGNPVYDWSRMAQDDFSWWMARIRRTLELTDVVRIDHFRALSAYWEVPTDAAATCKGNWVPGPGQPFFDVLKKHFPSLPLVVEDLGTLDDSTCQLRDQNSLFGMRILQFGFDGTQNNRHQPHRFPEQAIVYTGTHDNDPVAGWWSSLTPELKEEVSTYYQFSKEDNCGRVTWSLIEGAIGSCALVAVIPVQDLLVLDSRARMNDPSTYVGNWSWRMPPNGMSDELAATLRRLRDTYRPVGQSEPSEPEPGRPSDPPPSTKKSAVQ